MGSSAIITVISRCAKAFKWPVDLLVTVLLWIGLGLIEPLLFALPYGLVRLLWRDRERGFQWLNHAYYRVFFGMVRVVVPGLKLCIPPELRAIRSSIVICNHLSYLDSILLVSLLPRHKTVIKGVFGRVPVFGWAVRNAGYLLTGQPTGLSLASLRPLREFVQSGGSVFIFPEGTRSRDAGSRFNRGAFALARHCRAPIEVLRIQGTDTLFGRGRILFNTCVRNTIQLVRIATVPAEEVARVASAALAERVRQLYLPPAQGSAQNKSTD
jgi:1-acyl-sn-glycerol-3-phosphate acyltransferase